MTTDAIKKPLAVLLATAMLAAPATGISPFAARPAAAQGYGQEDRYTKQQLENLLAPVALYPDPLLAQVLVAASFDEEVEEASRLVRRHRNLDIDDQPWDVSVKAVAHYPSVIHMMADKIDWTVAVGQAYVEQPEDVMAAVQFLRWQAHRAGNLRSNDHHRVVVVKEYVEIVPYRPDVIFVPVYEPEIVFFRPAAVITFGVAFPIGVWLIHDVDWHGRRVYYHGWSGDRHWIRHSRPHVRITNVYVNNRYTVVNVNRNIVRRNVNVTNINRFNSVNRNVSYTNIERRNQIRGSAGDVRRASRRDGAEKALQTEKAVSRGRDRGDTGAKSAREARSERVKQEQSAGKRPADGTPEGSLEKPPDARAARRARQGQDGPAPTSVKGGQPQSVDSGAPDGKTDRDRSRRVRQSQDAQGHQNFQGQQGGREPARAKQPQAQEAKQKKQEKNNQDKQGRPER
ncbi:MAG: DUF3300 domain-containing protein [Candidatus Binatia bacterium]